MPRFQRIATIAAALLASAPAFASTVTWAFDLTTTGNNVNYVSPTATDPDAPQFATVVQINRVEVKVRYLIFNLGPFDITDQLDEDQLFTEASVIGPAPLTLYDDAIVAPPPPDAPAFAGTLNVGINAAGFGTASVTNVTLGTFPYDLGPPFGVQNVTLTSVRVEGSITITPIYAGDLDGDGAVDLSDLATLLSNFGVTSGAQDIDGDTNNDGAVNLTDLATLLGNFGRN